jgi:diguanylate cyclase (GGDEF)-like protein/PAS domain S-box-containing protein
MDVCSKDDSVTAAQPVNPEAAPQGLRESEERFRGAFEHCSVGMALVAPDGRWLETNPAFCRMLGYSADELRLRTFVDVSHPDDVGVSITRDCELLSGTRDHYQLQKRYLRRDGSIVWALLSVSLVRDHDRKPQFFVAQVLDVSAQRRAEADLRESEERYRELFESASDLIQVADERGRLQYVNRAWRDKLGYGEHEVRGLALGDVLDPAHREPALKTLEGLGDGEASGVLEMRFRTRDGRAIVVEGTVSCSRRLAGPAVLRGIFRDVTERRAFEELLDEYRHGLEDANRKLAAANTRLEELATTDPLTGLKNRLVLQQKLEDEFQRTHRYRAPLSLILMDVDRFKAFNDTFGHLAGDEVLREVARLLGAAARTTDVVSRFGGEEFAILLPNTDLEGATSLAERFRVSIESAPWPRRRVTASFGVAAVTPEMADASALVSTADAALYRAKQFGRNRVEWPGMEKLEETALMHRPLRK